MQALTALLALALIAGPAAAQAFDFARDPAPLFELSSYQAGESPAHGLSFSALGGELETYRARVTYPDTFRFRGFHALGPNDSQVGALMVDLNSDGRPDLTVVLRSLSSGSAYADVIPDGRFSPGVEPVLRHAGLATFLLQLPFGGDANASTVVVPSDARLTLVLSQGLIVNPSRAGTYVITAELVSVDPDTDGPDDGAGASPLGVVFDVSVPIEGPALVPFATLCVDGADVVRVPSAFRVHGRYALGPGSNGIDLRVDGVKVTFAGFAQEIPGAAFAALGHGARFQRDAPGITRLHLHDDGRFEIDARGLDPAELDLRRPVLFALQIGDDRGEAALHFDAHGHVRAGPRRCVR